MDRCVARDGPLVAEKIITAYMELGILPSHGQNPFEFVHVFESCTWWLFPDLNNL